MTPPDAALSDAVFSTPARLVGGPAPLAPLPPQPDPSTRKARVTAEYLVGGDRWGTLGGYLKSLPPWIDRLTFEFGPDLYDRMQLDDQVSSSLRALVHSVLSDDLALRPGVDDDGNPDFAAAKDVLGFMERATWEGRGGTDEWLFAMAKGALGGGNRVSETVLRLEESGKDAGKMTLDRLKVKPRRSFSFLVDAFNNLVALRGLIPGRYGSGLAWGADVDPGRPGENDLPREKFCVLAWDPPEGDPRGSAILRCVYEPWWAKLQTARDWLANLAQFGTPSLVGKTAPGADSSAATDGYGNPTADGVVLTPEQDFLNQILAFRNGSAIVIPAGAELEALTVSNAGKAFADKVDACDRAIAQGILLAMRAVMQSRFGSRADAEQGQDVAGLQSRFMKRWLARMVTEDLLRFLYRVNYGTDADPRLCPYASLSPVEHQDLGASLVAMTGAYKAGFLKPSQLPWAYEQFGMPPATPEEMRPPPAAQPLQGAGGLRPPNAQDGQPPAPANGPAAAPQAPFSADQPRVPAGSPEGGEWGSGGAGGGAGATVERKKRLARKAQDAAFRAAYEAQEAYKKALGLIPADVPELHGLVKTALRHLGTEAYGAAVDTRRPILSAMYRAGTHGRLPPEAVHQLHVAGAYGADARKLAQKAERLFVSAYRQKGRERKAGKGRAPQAPFAWDESKHPRLPAGSAEGGEWGPGGGGGGAAVAEKPPPKKPRVDVGLTDKEEVAIAKIIKGPLKIRGGLTAEQLAALAGAPDGGQATVRPGEDKKSLVIHVSNDFTAVRHLRRLGSGELIMENQEIKVKESEQGKGLGTEVFGRQVDAARALGVGSIRCHAARKDREGNDAYNGYSTWPRLGYDQDFEDLEGQGPAGADLAARARAAFPGAGSVLQVMATPEGRAWWRRNGTDLFKAKFDLADGSNSMKVLNVYRQEKARG